MSLRDFFEASPSGALRFSGEAPGAYLNGTRIRKVHSEPGDMMPDGSLGTVVGSLKSPVAMLKQFPNAHYAYSVEWDAAKGLPVLLMSFKVERV